jgi:hypothetical protein
VLKWGWCPVLVVLQVISRRSGKKRGRRAAAAGRSHAGPIVSSRENTGPQRAAQAAAGACGSLPAFAGVAYLRELSYFVGEFLFKAMACIGLQRGSFPSLAPLLPASPHIGLSLYTPTSKAHTADCETQCFHW